MKYYDYRDTWKGEWIMAVFVRIRGKEGKKNAKIWQRISLERLKSFLLKLQSFYSLKNWNSFFFSMRTPNNLKIFCKSHR